MTKLTDQQLITALTILFDQIPPPETPEEVDATLRAAGYDPDEVGRRMAEVAEEALEKARVFMSSEE